MKKFQYEKVSSVAQGRRAGTNGLKRLSPTLVGSPSKHAGGHRKPKERNIKRK